MSALDEYMVRASIEHARSCPRWERLLVAGVACDCSAYTLPFAARTELTALRSSIDALDKQAHCDRLSLSMAIAGNIEWIRLTHGGNAPERIQSEIDDALALNRSIGLLRDENAILRATIAQQQKRIEAAERVAEEFEKVDHSFLCHAGEYGAKEPCRCDLAPLAKAIESFRKTRIEEPTTERNSP